MSELGIQGTCIHCESSGPGAMSWWSFSNVSTSSTSQCGSALAQRLRSRQPELKVLYLSGYPDDVLAGQDVLGPGRAFLRKPFRADDLVRKVRQVLDT